MQSVVVASELPPVLHCQQLLHLRPRHVHRVPLGHLDRKPGRGNIRPCSKHSLTAAIADCLIDNETEATGQETGYHVLFVYFTLQVLEYSTSV